MALRATSGFDRVLYHGITVRWPRGIVKSWVGVAGALLVRQAQCASTGLLFLRSRPALAKRLASFNPTYIYACHLRVVSFVVISILYMLSEVRSQSLHGGDLLLHNNTVPIPTFLRRAEPEATDADRTYSILSCSTLRRAYVLIPAGLLPLHDRDTATPSRTWIEGIIASIAGRYLRDKGDQGIMARGKRSVS